MKGEPWEYSQGDQAFPTLLVALIPIVFPCHYEKEQNLPIVLTLAEGLPNVAGTEDFSEPLPLFILSPGM